MKYSKYLSVVIICMFFIIEFSFLNPVHAQTLADFKILNPSPESGQSVFQRYGYFSQYLGQSGEEISYLYSKDDNFTENDTLKTYLLKNNYQVKIFDNEGLVMTITVTKFSSTDGLFNGYAAWSQPVWNEDNPNVIKNKPVNEESFRDNIYKAETFDYFATECGVYAGWNPQMPSHFVSRRDKDRTEQERNIYKFKTLVPVSVYTDRPLSFWAECGNLNLKDVKSKNY